MVELLLPEKLKDKIENFYKSITGNKKFKLNKKEFFIEKLPPYILNFTHYFGKVSEIIYYITSNYSKKSFDIFKVGESLYVSTAYQPYYTTIRKQKEEIENNIKSQLIHIAAAITDTQLIAHDYRKYLGFLKKFKELEKLKQQINEEKNEIRKNELLKKKKELEISLRSIFIDQVDVHTGDFSIVNLARTRWTTFISDFLSLDDEKHPEEILNKLKNITKAEAIQLAKKNQLYLEWKREFEKIVSEREAELRKLLIMRKNSIERYKEMLRPLIARYLTIKEEPSFFISSSLPFIKAATYPLLVESTKLWIIKSIPPYMFEYEKTKPSKISLESIGILSNEINEMIDVSLKEKSIEITMPLEPSIDRIVLAGLEVINDEFGTQLNINDVLLIREELYKKEYSPSPSKERWKLSPYYVFVEVALDRTLLKTQSGIEIEDFWFEIKPFIISQNIALLMYLQTKALDNYYENQINSFFGESLMKEVEVEVEIDQKNKVKQKLNVWLDIRSIDYILEDEDFLTIENLRRKKIYEILSNYSEKFEKLFLSPSRFFSLINLYETSVAKEYFSDYLVSLKRDIDNLIANSFGFPI